MNELTVMYVCPQNAGEMSVDHIETLVNNKGETPTAELRLKLQKVRQRTSN